ncbi:MAG: GNAT family N-acetyltransferase, partial [Bifidobacteriaceae bacterium]|nr:GNAT family N-acetyltransferase [Bifidobacteriaceae bacterium]
MDSAPAPHRLGPDNLTEGFASGARELDQWLTRFALENQRAGNAVVYVVERDGRIAGYYAIAMAGVSRELVPERLHPRSRPTEVPCALLARLAADMRWQGMGLGRLLLR